MWLHLCDSCGVGPHVYGSCPGPKLEQLETTFLTIIYTFWPLQNHISSTLSFGCWALRGGNVPTWLGQEGRWMGAGKVPIMVKKGTFLILNLIVWLDELCVPMQIYSPTQWSQYNAIRVTHNCLYQGSRCSCAYFTKVLRHISFDVEVFGCGWVGFKPPINGLH